MTSASHMPRALATFRKAGQVLEPAATDASYGGGDAPFPLPFLPDAESLDVSIYHWRGWA